jgi:hypothetical protein
MFSGMRPLPLQGRHCCILSLILRPLPPTLSTKPRPPQYWHGTSTETVSSTEARSLRVIPACSAGMPSLLAAPRPRPPGVHRSDPSDDRLSPRGWHVEGDAPPRRSDHLDAPGGIGDPELERRPNALPGQFGFLINSAVDERQNSARDGDGCARRGFGPHGDQAHAAGAYLFTTKDPQLQGLRRARATGLEPATSGVTGRRSNQLSYARVQRGPSIAASGWAAGTTAALLDLRHDQPGQEADHRDEVGDRGQDVAGVGVQHPSNVRSPHSRGRLRA